MTDTGPYNAAGRTLSFDGFDDYEGWLRRNPHGLERPDRTVAERFHEVADLTDAMAMLSPYEQPHFVASFDSFEEYEAWKDGQANPWNW